VKQMLATPLPLKGEMQQCFGHLMPGDVVLGVAPQPTGVQRVTLPPDVTTREQARVSAGVLSYLRCGMGRVHVSSVWGSEGGPELRL
jgi:hypothetical protein